MRKASRYVYLKEQANSFARIYGAMMQNIIIVSVQNRVSWKQMEKEYTKQNKMNNHREIL